MPNTAQPPKQRSRQREALDDEDDTLREVGEDHEFELDDEIDPAVRYGFGWRISEHAGQRLVWHTGETIGFHNAIMRFPDRHLTVVLLTNRDEAEHYKIALEIADMFLGQ